MINLSKHSFIKCAYILIDVFFISVAIFLACWSRSSTLSFHVDFYSLFLDPANPYRLIFFSWMLTAVLINNSNELYQTRREIAESLEVWNVIRSVCFSSLLVIVLKYVVKIEGFPRSVFITTVILTIVFFSIWRILKRYFVNFLVSKGYNNFKVIIIGAGKVGLTLAKEIKDRPHLGIRIVGFLDDFKTDLRPENSSCKIIGKLDQFAELAQKEFINKVFITIHHDSQVFLTILEQARDLGIAVRVVPQGFDLTTGEFWKYNIGFIPILEYCNVENFRNQFGKRLFDFIIGVVTLILLAPVLCIISLLIKTDSQGPVFYKSKRYGRYGRMFHMYKFRSMVSDAEKQINTLKSQNEVDGPIFKMKKDPRVTRVGIVLRKYSLDELPQLFNVLKGDMSLVGPRPLPIDQIEKEDLRQLKRLEVRPGITGLWQIRGRSDLSFSRLVKWDIWYINNWSLWLDINILLQTIPVVIKAKGAY